MPGQHRVRRRDTATVALIAGLIGILAALALPFAPVIATEAIVTWPASGQAPTSTTALFVPYRPAQLNATVPCAALRTDGDATILATGPPGAGLVIRTVGTGAELLLDERTIPLHPGGIDCAVAVDADATGVTVTDGGHTARFDDQRVPKVFGFRTDLSPERALGITVTARTASVFGTSPTTLKSALVVVQLSAAAVVLLLLNRRSAGALRSRLRRARIFWRLTWVDAGVVGILLGWALVGPLAVDDGWAMTIAREYSDTGDAGNYYRWWNASETPFAFSQQILSNFTDVSLAPLWLRVPSTLLALATWFVLSRGVLGAAMGARARIVPLRLLAAVFFLAAWLPYNLGVRPESYVAFGITTLIALMWRARRVGTLGWAALVIALTLPISPTSVVLAAPIVVFGPRAARTLRRQTGGRWQVVAYAVSLGCLASVALTVIFADSTWNAVVTATDWHRYFGPSLPWYQEAERYHYLFGEGQQGSFAKRLPVLLAAALLPVVVVLRCLGPRRHIARSAARLAAVTLAAVLLLALGPSKWSYHLGALAGVFAAFATVAVALLIDQARAAVGLREAVTGVAGAVLMCFAVALAFTGANAWWLPAVYKVPWPEAAIRPLNSAVWWIGVLVVVGVIVDSAGSGSDRARIIRAVFTAPAAVATSAAVASVVILAVSFAGAPIRHPAGSLALANLHWLTGEAVCGLADDIEVLQDGAALGPVTSPGAIAGFVAREGFPPESPPPAMAGPEVWGSHGAREPASVTTPWFALPEGHGVTVSVSGRTGRGNALSFEFGTERGSPERPSDTERGSPERPPGVVTLRTITPPDPVPPAEDPGRPPWRAVAVSADQIPPDANRVRLHAVDDDPGSWFAFTGPRLHAAVAMSAFLASHGPVLIAWPMGFLFPCVHNTARVVHGLAQTPGSFVVSPGPWYTEPTDPKIGGDFAAISYYARLYEVPTRVLGDPQLDWGTLLLPTGDPVPDAYDVELTEVRRPGAGERRGHQSEPER